MLRARRSSVSPNVEITPLIDVVFLLLTFFVFALILTVRMDATDIRLPEVRSGADAPPASRPVVVGMTAAGEVTLGQTVLAEADTPITPEDSSAILNALQDSAGPLQEGAAAEETRLPTLMLAIDEQARHGRILELLDSLRSAGITDFRFLRSPNPPQPAAPNPTSPER